MSEEGWGRSVGDEAEQDGGRGIAEGEGEIGAAPEGLQAAAGDGGSGRLDPWRLRRRDDDTELRQR